MVFSLRNIFTAAAVLSATAIAAPQGPGGQGGAQGGGQQGSGSVATTTSSWAPTTSNWASASASATSTTSASAVQAVSTSTACNNSPDLCDRQYSNVTHMGAHDSAFLRDASTDNSISGNQYFNATYALNAGLRLLQTQVHLLNGTLENCHTTCDLLDGGSLESWLSAIKDWMDENTDEVVTLLIVNSDDQDVSDFGSVFESSGIDEYGYTPDGSGWPTLGSMISANTRLVTFIASINSSTTYSYLLPEFEYVFETAYDVRSLSGFNCSIDRPTTYDSASAAISDGLLPLMNHFAYSAIGSVEIPNVSDIDTTNSPDTNTTGALGTHAYQCYNEWAQAPTFVLVDFYSEGPAIDTADNINGITATGRSDSSDSSSVAANPRGLGVKTGALVAFFAAAVLLV
ncbi:PLC-like phosphodiesterase [Pseudomassariella vexata]|uniref:PLC-like phosphodiesterase n=1 Tax=Pseudomassariella vexata TaxID=1141098 RepID=A0A1Y2EDY8_9PEZI|nr:PLC-like phosphodiesterase [Pseudomassariella vexata]ORY69789.1 PLC-like phosphodiesterase [Pseudomassariella vexata]